jgi:hypothetical protein
MSLPTTGEVFAQLIEHIAKAQEAAAMLYHLEADNNKLQAQGWLAVSEMFKLTRTNVTKLAMKKAH